MKNNRIQVLSEIALAIALAAVLNLWKIALPFNVAGGTISLTMLPLLVVAIRRGAGAGIVAGALYGTIDLIFNPFVLHWAQVILDYPLPYMLVGLAGLGSKGYRKRVAADPVKATLFTIPWMVLGGVGRLVAHVLSGVIYFAEYAPKTQNVWVYSTLYNVSYVGPSLLACILLALLILPALERAVPVART